jgi:hypothetical protein
MNSLCWDGMVMLKERKTTECEKKMLQLQWKEKEKGRSRENGNRRLKRI